MTLAVVLLGLVGAGCARTTYVPYDRPSDALPIGERQVAVELDRVYFEDPPSCAVVLRPQGTEDAAVADLVDRALARQLSGRLIRVVGPLERRQLERSLALDLENPADWPTFARATGCEAVFEAIVTDVDEDYFVIWARRSLGLEVALRRVSDRAVYWKARHVARRSDGGLPLSPFSFALSGYEAGRFQNDADILPSLVDDLVRRMVASLPDLR